MLRARDRNPLGLANDHAGANVARATNQQRHTHLGFRV